MTLFVSAVCLWVGFWILERTWLWLGEAREILSKEIEEAGAGS